MSPQRDERTASDDALSSPWRAVARESERGAGRIVRRLARPETPSSRSRGLRLVCVHPQSTVFLKTTLALQENRVRRNSDCSIDLLVAHSSLEHDAALRDADTTEVDTTEVED